MTQAAIGILMLDTEFPRPPGDIGNTATWGFPVFMRKVGGASAQKVVLEDPRQLFDAFVAAGRDLISEGCAGLATSCGFLSLMQGELKEALGVPFASSPLMQFPMVHALNPAKCRVGILTISKENLSPAHLQAAGVHGAVPIEGLPKDGAFARAIFEDAPEMDFEACRDEMVSAAKRLAEDCPNLGAIVLECTNMAPYAADIAAATGCPVYSIVSFLNWFHAGLNPPRY